MESEKEEHQQQLNIPPQSQIEPPISLRNGGGDGVRYRECKKNHAVNMGGHAVDGCGEFMPAAEDGSPDALRCAACNCHRNFHRKETPPVGPMYPQFPPPGLYQRPPGGYPYVAYQVPMALPPSSSSGGMADEMEELSHPSSSKKRFRSKFTQEQKEKMRVFAERVGWRIQKHDESEVQRFCQELHIDRQVLKVWMHNNKNS